MSISALAKRLMLFANLSLLLVLAASCGKDEAVDPVSPADTVAADANTPRLAEVRLVRQDVTTKYDYSGGVLSADTDSYDVVVQRWTWHADTLASIAYYDIATGEPLYTSLFSYVGGKLLSIQRQGTTTIYNFHSSGNWLDSIVTTKNGTCTKSATFEYDGSERPLCAYIGTPGSTPTKYSFVWQGQNMSSYAVTMSSTTTTESYDYDSAYNPFYMKEDNIGALNISANNRTMSVSDYVDGTYHTTDTIRYSYRYDGDKPIECLYTKRSTVGRYVNEYRYHYYYSYLDD